MNRQISVKTGVSEGLLRPGKAQKVYVMLEIYKKLKNSCVRFMIILRIGMRLKNAAKFCGTYGIYWAKVYGMRIRMNLKR
ncbi:MAG: hypothetical protein M0021_00875 [Clostridia bacterium]|nr:hypothetical protein [Clostridia bacterium]